jgi:hypothetical protein
MEYSIVDNEAFVRDTLIMIIMLESIVFFLACGYLGEALCDSYCARGGEEVDVEAQVSYPPPKINAT